MKKVSPSPLLKANFGGVAVSSVGLEPDSPREKHRMLWAPAGSFSKRRGFKKGRAALSI